MIQFSSCWQEDRLSPISPAVVGGRTKVTLIWPPASLVIHWEASTETASHAHALVHTHAHALVHTHTHTHAHAHVAHLDREAHSSRVSAVEE